MIFVCYRSHDYNDTYFIEQFQTKEEAIDFVSRNDGYYLRDTFFVEGNMLKITLGKEEEDEVSSVSR